MQSSNWKWHLDEVFVKINGERHYLWRAVDHEGEVLESYVTKRETKKQLWSSWRKSCGAMDHQMRSSQINWGPTVQQQENWAVRKSRLLSDGQTTELRIHTYPFDDEKEPCFDLDECTVYRSSPQFMLRFTICSTHKGHFQNVAHSN